MNNGLNFKFLMNSEYQTPPPHPDPHVFEFPDFFHQSAPISKEKHCLFRRENLVFCPATIILIKIAPIFDKLLKKLGYAIMGGVNGHRFMIIDT